MREEPMAWIAVPVLRAWELIGTHDDDPVKVILDSDGAWRFHHRCDRKARDAGVIIVPIPLHPQHVVMIANGTVTITPSVLCSDCGAHGYVTDGVWLPV